MTGQPQPSIFEFDGYELDVTQRRLRSKDGRLIALTPRVFEALSYLVAHAGQLVEKSALLEAVWPRVVVEEGSLSQAIYELRRALGERPDEHRFIVTVPGRGYQFVAEVTRRERRSMNTAEAKPPDVPRQPAMTPAAVPRSRLRHVVTAIGIAASGVAAWYVIGMRPFVPSDRQAGNPPAAVATVAGLPFGDPGPHAKGMTADPRANEHFLLARFFVTRRQAGDLRRAEQEYRRAVQLDPTFARAWVGLSGVYYVSLDRYVDLGLSRPQALESMREAVDRALELDPELAEAHVRRSMYQLEAGDRSNFREHAQRAAALEPHNPVVLFWLSEIALNEGRPDDAVELQSVAARHNPLVPVTRANLGTNLYFAGKFDEAATELRTALQIAGTPDAVWGSPNDPASAAGTTLAKVLMAQRRYDEALTLIQTWPPGQLRDSCLAQVHHARGESSEADAALKRLVASATAEPHWIAETYAHRGEVDQAFRWLAIAGERSRERHDGRQTWRLDIRYSPLVTALHSDRRWQAWLAETTF